MEEKKNIEVTTKDAGGDVFKAIFLVIAAILFLVACICTLSTLLDKEPFLYAAISWGGCAASALSSWLISTLSSINVNLKEINSKLKNNNQQ